MKVTIKEISANAIVAALYVALTLASYPLSYGHIQFRISEMLILLCFFNKKYTVGLTLGCLIANLFSSVGLIDVVIGTTATLISCLIMCFLKHLALSAIVPIIANGLLVGFEIEFFFTANMVWANFNVSRFFINCLTVGLGELVVMIAGYILFMILKRRKDFFRFIVANQNIDFKW